MKLNAKAFALAGGVLWGLAMFAGTLIVVQTGYADQFFGLFVNAYPWYEVSLQGAVIGALWGFVDAGIGCWVFAALYNKFAGK
jgi:hypothetical protein